MNNESDPFNKARELHSDWTISHKRVIRSAGHDSAINLEFAPLDAEMDAILDDYNDLQKAILGGVVVRVANQS